MIKLNSNEKTNKQKKRHLQAPENFGEFKTRFTLNLHDIQITRHDFQIEDE